MSALRLPPRKVCGFAPLAAQLPVDLTGSKLSPSYYMAATALIGLAAFVALQRRYKV
ncbi:MAG: hypothetical protein WBQ24_01810 [Xanthobacteraceae bacterium]